MIGQSADNNFAYLLGVFLGDGCVTRMSKYTVFRLNTIDREFAEAVRDTWITLTGGKTNLCTYPVSKSSKLNHSLTCRDDGMCKRLLADTIRKQIIPDYVFKWSKELKLEFIGGLMDSEGFVAANSNPTNRRYYMGYKSCDVWVPDFVRILQSVEIQIGKVSSEEPRKEHYKVPTRFHIKMDSWVNSGARFRIQRKQQRVDTWASEDAYVQRERRKSQRLPVELPK